MTTTQNTAFFLLVVFLALVPVPLGSNRPFFWYANGAFIASLTIFYLARIRAHDRSLRFPLRQIWPEWVLILAVPIWLAVQVLPVPEYLANPIWKEAGSALKQPLVQTISVDPAATLGMIVRYLTYLLLFFISLQLTVNSYRARKLLMAVFWIVVGHAMIGFTSLFQWGDSILGAPKWAYQGFATGTFVNRNSFATFLAFGAVVGTALILDELRLGNRARSSDESSRKQPLFVMLGFYGTGLFVVLSTLVLTGSRMGATAAATGVLIIVLIFLIMSSEGRRHFGFWVLLGAALTAGILWHSGGRLIDRVGSLETSTDERLNLYSQVVDMITARPWTGYGGGSFDTAFPLFHKLPLSADVTWDAAHNLYLELVSDLGAVGIVPIFVTILLTARLVWGLWSNGAGIAAISAIGVVCVAAVHSTVDFSLQIEANVLFFVVILATGVARSQARKAAEGGLHEPPVPTGGLPEGP